MEFGMNARSEMRYSKYTMKKYLLILLITSPLYAAPTTGEIYSCYYDFGSSEINFSLKRVIYSKTFEQFQHQVRDEAPELMSITRETDDYIHLMRDVRGAASIQIIGKKDNTWVGAYLEHNKSSKAFNGECFLVK